jgi:hypothetical protein
MRELNAQIREPLSPLRRRQRLHDGLLSNSLCDCSFLLARQHTLTTTLRRLPLRDNHTLSFLKQDI